jgi:hypothetical protein
VGKFRGKEFCYVKPGACKKANSVSHLKGFDWVYCSYPQLLVTQVAPGKRVAGAETKGAPAPEPTPAPTLVPIPSLTEYQMHRRILIFVGSALAATFSIALSVYTFYARKRKYRQQFEQAEKDKTTIQGLATRLNELVAKETAVPQASVVYPPSSPVPYQERIKQLEFKLAILTSSSPRVSV